MTMTPQDIQSQQFHVRFRGFDVEEVDSFLERVAEEYLILMEENRQLNEQLEEMRNEIESYHLREKSFQKAIISAQQIVDEMKNKSRKEAEELLAAAQEEARQLNAEARAEVATLKNDLERLQKIKIETRQELKQTLLGYLAFLENESGFGKAGEGLAGRQSAAERSADDEIDDLYEKIDLPEETSAAVADGSEPISDIEDGLFKMKELEEEIPESTVPDLDGDMLFDLDDPLDDEGPAITFDLDHDDQEQRRAG
jgi:cell division initiation protein